GFGGEVRAVEMGAEDAGAAGAFPHQPATDAQKRQVLVVPGDGRSRQQAGRAVAGVGAADRAERLGGAVHEVGPRAAVDVEIDVTRDEVAAFEVDNAGTVQGGQCGADRADAPAGDVDVAVFEDAIGQDNASAAEVQGHCHVDSVFGGRTSRRA